MSFSSTVCSALALLSSAAPAPPAGVVAVEAGTIHLVENGEVIEGGGVILIRDGRIVAAGRDVAVPPGALVVDYGPDAVIIPGLVAADSPYGSFAAAERTADPGLRAVDGFDPFSSYVWALSGGVTSAYLAPARGRLIAGQGAVVKLAGAPGPARVLSASAALHGAISAEARSTPGYWQPPIPARVDIGLGVEQPQLPRTVTGAVIALRELLALARSRSASEEYGPYAGPELADVLERRIPWRLGAQTASEIRALLELAPEIRAPLVVDGAQSGGDLAAELAAAGVDVIVDAPIRPNLPPLDYGKEPDAVWPRFDVAARLAQAGCRFAIATPDGVSAGELLHAARVASRGGLDPAAALRAITLAPAEILGVAERVGSLAPGKDADLVVLNGPPLSGAAVVATWIGGEAVWTVEKQTETAVVLGVEQLHVGDGSVLAPAEILMQGGRIVDVGARVARPAGARVIRGRVAVPGMIDALGHLGLEGSRKVPATRFAMSRLVEPGDAADRRVARAGVTTVALAPRGTNRSGAPVMAYKPAAEDVERQVVEDPTALRFQWTDKNRIESGQAVRDVLKKAVDYAAKWKEYEEALAKWTPPPPEPEKAGDKAEGDKASGETKEGASGDAEKGKDADKAKEDEKDADAKKKAKKSKKKEDVPAAPITGAWVAEVEPSPDAPSRLRLQLLDEEGRLSGLLRCAALSDDLIEVSGTREERKVSLSGRGSRGPVEIDATVEDADDEDEPRRLKGSASAGEQQIAFDAEQTSSEYEIARRPERRRPPAEEKKRAKGEPKEPNVDPDLEPIRRAFAGEVALIVDVDRADEILACVDAFASAGLKPVLYGAQDAYKVAEEIRGRVAGVLLLHEVVRTDPRTGAERHNRYAELVAAGIPVAFHSDAEEGAAELPLVAAYAVSQGMSAQGALRALTADAADMLAIGDRVGRIAAGLDGDVLLLDGDPFDPATSVVRVWVNGKEVR